MYAHSAAAASYSPCTGEVCDSVTRTTSGMRRDRASMSVVSNAFSTPDTNCAPLQSLGVQDVHGFVDRALAIVATNDPKLVID